MRRVLALLRICLIGDWVRVSIAAISSLHLAVEIAFPAIHATSTFFLPLWMLLVALAFRGLVGNCRLSLLPGFRQSAVAALVTVAVAAGVIAGGADIAHGHPNAVTAALTAFALASAALLLGQWLCTFRAGLLVAIGLIAAAVWFGRSRGDLIAALYASTMPVTLAALAALAGWAWLLRAMQRPVLANPCYPELTSRRAPPEAEAPDGDCPPPAGRRRPAWRLGRGTREVAAIGSPVSTLMRGMAATLSVRVLVPFAVFLGPAALAGVATYLLNDTGVLRVPRDPLGHALLVSVCSASFLLAWYTAEWPARLRYLWLRAAGDRPRLWRVMEHALLADMSIFVGGAALVALALLVDGRTSPLLVGAWLAICALGPLLCAYGLLALAARGGNVTSMRVILNTALIVAIIFGGRSSASFAPDPEFLAWSLPSLGALVVILRTIARRRALAIDWCKLRPERGMRPYGMYYRPASR